MTFGEFLQALFSNIAFLILLAVLIGLWVTTTIVGKLMRRKQDASAPPGTSRASTTTPHSASSSMQTQSTSREGAPLPAPVAPGDSAAVQPAPAGVQPEEAAAIVAAVTLLFGARSRIVSIRPSVADWSRQGRREHHTSHRLR